MTIRSRFRSTLGGRLLANRLFLIHVTLSTSFLFAQKMPAKPIACPAPALEAKETSAPDSEIPEYERKRENEEQIRIEMDYAGTRIKNHSKIPKNNFGIITTITYIHSKCSKGKFNQSALDSQRKNKLTKLFPQLKDNHLVQWQEEIQADCGNRKNSKNLFHGYIISYRPRPSEATMKKEIEYLKTKVSVIRETTACKISDFKPYKKDDTIQKVFNRNQKWDTMVVADLTGSMSPYAAELILYFKLQTQKKENRKFLFFNDGDNKPDSEKIAGETGGLYFQNVKDYEELVKLASETMSHGFGGDAPENDIEALLEAQKRCPECKELILIADNFAGMRDLSLADKITVPVRVVLCGAFAGLNLEMLFLARITGGSIHTIEADIMDLAKKNENEIIEYGGQKYIIKKGRFHLLRET